MMISSIVAARDCVNGAGGCRRACRLPVAATVLALALASFSVAAQPADGAQDGSGRHRFADLVADTKAYVTAPLHADRKQWVKFGSVVAGLGVAYHYDERVREHFVTELVPAEEPDTHDSQDAAPAALALAGTWLAARLLDDDDGRREAGMMVESAAFSTVATYVLKEIAARERPYVSGDHGGWDRGGDSFPSMHVTAAFAIGTVLAESGNDRQRWIRRVLGYGIAAGTAYQRMNHDAHWFSDTVAGAAIGVATARFVMKRRERDDGRAFMILPTGDGIQLTYAVPLR